MGIIGKNEENGNYKSEIFHSNFQAKTLQIIHMITYLEFYYSPLLVKLYLCHSDINSESVIAIGTPASIPAISVATCIPDTILFP